MSRNFQETSMNKTNARLDDEDDDEDISDSDEFNIAYELRVRSKSFTDLRSLKLNNQLPHYNELMRSSSMDELMASTTSAYEYDWDMSESDEILQNKYKMQSYNLVSKSFADLRTASMTKPFELPALKRRCSLDALLEYEQHRQIQKQCTKMAHKDTLDFKVCKLRILATLEIVERVVSSPYISEDFKLDILEKFDELFSTYLFERIKFNKSDRAAYPKKGEIREYVITGDYAYINF